MFDREALLEFIPYVGTQAVAHNHTNPVVAIHNGGFLS
jgi:hypothetical protein